VVARVLKCDAQAHALHFPLEYIIDGSGSAPICPPIQFCQARAAPMIHFVCRQVISLSKAAMKPPKNWPRNCQLYVKRLRQTLCRYFQTYEYNFFKIDAMLFTCQRDCHGGGVRPRVFAPASWIMLCWIVVWCLIS